MRRIGMISLDVNGLVNFFRFILSFGESRNVLRTGSLSVRMEFFKANLNILFEVLDQFECIEHLTGYVLMELCVQVP